MSYSKNKDLKWRRYRFYTHSEDNRPIIFNPKYPWWCSGYGEDSKGEYSVCISYLPENEDLLKHWDDASNIEFTKESEITFSERFPKPSYFIEI